MIVTAKHFDVAIITNNVNCGSRFRPVKGKQEEEWKAIVERFIRDQDYERAFEDFAASSAYTTFCLNKTKSQQAVIKEHVGAIVCSVSRNIL